MQRSAVTLVLMALAVTVNSANINSSKSKVVTTTQDPDEAIDQVKKQPQQDSVSMFANCFLVIEKGRSVPVFICRRS